MGARKRPVYQHAFEEECKTTSAPDPSGSGPEFEPFPAAEAEGLDVPVEWERSPSAQAGGTYVRFRTGRGAGFGEGGSSVALNRVIASYGSGSTFVLSARNRLT
jgi:hypothetical protein